MRRHEAHGIIATHGRHAHQHLLDLMVDALRSGEEQEAKRYEALLRDVERIRFGARDRTAEPE